MREHLIKMNLKYQYLWGLEVYCSIKLVPSGKKKIYKYPYSLSLVWEDSSLELLMVFHSVWHQVEVIYQHGPHKFHKHGALCKKSSVMEQVPSKTLYHWRNVAITWLSYLVRKSMDRVFEICKLAMKWYLMRMCVSWPCPFKVT